MILFIKLFKESAIFAWSSLVANKLRTLLTLLGITIGIFAIISVFTVVDTLERQIRSSIASLGDNVIYVQKWPWAFGGDYPWWKYMNRPTPRLSEVDAIMRNTQTIEAAVFIASTQRTVEHLNSRVEQASIMAVSEDYNRIRNFELQQGRYFSHMESISGRGVAMVGYEIAQNLFRNTDPIGKYIRVFGRNLEVIGVFTKEGANTFGNSHDELVVVPVNFISTFIETNNDEYNPSIMVMAREGISNEQMTDELTGAMRAIRRLKPTTEDNFALNETSLLSQGFDGLFAVLKLAGWVIGGFSILVGGFGIANIMFVSVRERTGIIGIQMALGAKKYFILLQFLTEAILLSLLGGMIGLVLVFGGAALASHFAEIDITLTYSNILLGINVSAIIGLVAGFVPAWSASRLNPVEAIRTNA